MTYYVIIRGPLGIGKSTISKKLANFINADYFSIDEVVDGQGLNKIKADDGFISEESFLKANELIIPKIKETLKSKNAVIDGNFYRKSQLDDLIKKLDTEHYVFTLKASLDTCIERDKHRAKPYGVDAATVVYNITTKFDYGVVIDTENKSAEDVVSKILDNI